VTRANAISIEMKIAAARERNRQELAELRASLSWRVTAPLRHLRTFQRRRAGPPRATPHEDEVASEAKSILGRRIG
jgi:hypothetical protein